MRDLRWVLFVFIVILKVDLERNAFCEVCIHRNVKGRFWRDLYLVLFLYILFLMVAFEETCFVCCFYTSYC